MNFDYSDANVVQGRANQDMAKEQPSTFATDSGADNVRQVTQLDKPKQRMRGRWAASFRMPTNPDEKERTDSWMSMFELSNEGQQFNQAKMGGAPPLG